MSDIYRSAQSVIIWMGLSEWQTADLWILSSDLAAAPGDQNRCDSECDDRQIGRRYKGLLVDIGSSEYWSRAWILQEAILAQRLVILTPEGPVSLKPILFRLVDEIIHQLHQYERRSEIGYLEKVVRYMTPEGQRVWQGGYAYSFGDAIELTQLRHCKVARDRIYSVASFATGGADLDINYHSTDEQVLWRTVRLAVFPAVGGRPTAHTRQEVMSHSLRTLEKTTNSASTTMMQDTMIAAITALRLDPPASQVMSSYPSLQALLIAFDDLKPQGYWIPNGSSHETIEAGSSNTENAQNRNWSICLPYIFPSHLAVFQQTVRVKEDTLGTGLNDRDPLDSEVWYAYPEVDGKPRKWQLLRASPGEEDQWERSDIKAYFANRLP